MNWHSIRSGIRQTFRDRYTGGFMGRELLPKEHQREYLEYYVFWAGAPPGGKEGKEQGTLIFFMIIRHSGLRDLWIQIAPGRKKRRRLGGGWRTGRKRRAERHIFGIFLSILVRRSKWPPPPSCFLLTIAILERDTRGEFRSTLSTASSRERCHTYLIPHSTPPLSHSLGIHRADPAPLALTSATAKH